MESWNTEQMIDQASRIVEHNLQYHELRELRSATVEKMLRAMDDNEIQLALNFRKQIREIDQKITEASSSSYPSH